MAVSNKDRITRALDLVREGLGPFVAREMHAKHGSGWRAYAYTPQAVPDAKIGKEPLDTHGLLKTVIDNWSSVFRHVLGQAERNYAGELIAVRNDWAHDKAITTADALRALDTAERLLNAVSAKPQADALREMASEVMRQRFEEQARNKTRYQRQQAMEGVGIPAGLKPWRDVVTPHPDVASGRFSEAEFMADLAQVDRGEGSSEYRDPQEFFRRTFLTEGLRRLLVGSLQRLSGKGGDPVIELQTNFGGGKTHSLLALFHLARAGGSAAALPGVEQVLVEAGVETPPKARLAVLVGTARGPGELFRPSGGPETGTLWGEMAWRLLGEEGYAMIAESDRTRTAPGSETLARLLRAASPCVVLVDEWVAFSRQLHMAPDMPAGSFDANLTFAQSLTEAAKATDRALVVASLPVSDIEIGGEGGQQALARLKNTFSRVESSWLPASADEGFEIVRRRLFESVSAEDAPYRDATVRAFSEFYRNHEGEFPSAAKEPDYRRRMERAYPIHPEFFERLYNDWGSLDRFQRTRGVLRLMATVIHTLWETNDPGLLIMPASVPIADPAVQPELARYLEESWSAVIAADVDGENSRALGLDREAPNLGRYQAARRVARTVWIGSAPTHESQSRGIDERQVKLGCAQPGESPATFGDALRRLSNAGTYLHQDGPRYWFSTQPSLSRMADDRAAALPLDEVDDWIVKRLKDEERNRGAFAGVHAAPSTSGDVADEREGRLVILGPEHPHLRNGNESAARKAADEMLRNRGGSQRNFRNALIFLAPDAQRLQTLRDGVRSLLAWQSIVGDRKVLDLRESQIGQAETRLADAKRTVEARIPDAWIWALAPRQPEPSQPEVVWDEWRLQGQGGLAERTARKLGNDGEEVFFTKIGPLRLKRALDRVWREDQPHLSTRQVWDWLTTYLYMPRLRDVHVLQAALEQAIEGLVNDTFAYAEGYDEARQRYLGLKLTGGGRCAVESETLIVRREVAERQMPEPPAPPEPPEPGPEGPGPVGPRPVRPEPGEDNGEPLPSRFFGAVQIDPLRAPRQVGQIAEEVLQHLLVEPGAKVEIKVEISAALPNGADENVQRTITENCRTLKFDDFGFERET